MSTDTNKGALWLERLPTFEEFSEWCGRSINWKHRYMLDTQVWQQSFVSELLWRAFLKSFVLFLATDTSEDGDLYEEFTEALRDDA